MIKEKISKIFNKTNIIIEFLLSILLSASILDYFYVKFYREETKIINIICIVVLSILIFSIIIYNIIKNKGKLEIYFLIFMIPIGLMYQIFLAPNYVPDELVHMYKAYDISEGNIITRIDESGDSKIELPKILTTGFSNANDNYTDIEKTYNMNTDYNDVVLEYSSAQAYSPILYIFSSIGFFISRLFNLNIVIAVYLARLLNFIAFLVCGYIAIKIIPFGKLIMVTYLFNPMLIHQAISISADSITNSSILLFIAYTLNILNEKQELTKKTKILYFILAIIVSISKNIYFPIVGLALLLFNKKCIKNKSDKIFIIGTVAIGCICAVLWYLFGTLYKDVFIDVMQMGYNPSEQIKNIISNPINCVVVLLRTMITSWRYYLYTFLGSNMGWLNIVPETSIHLITYIVLIVLAPFVEKNDNSLSNIQRLWCMLILLGIIFLMLVGFYINSTVIGDVEVQGIQGRYFIPIAILPFICMTIKDKNLNIKYIYEMYLPILCAINSIQILTILKFFLK